ncbi:MAG: ABC transporter permease, partial [Proteobacteria bacterium]|nr:ABC transporter permease [Pseudomonadota bacterium]
MVRPGSRNSRGRRGGAGSGGLFSDRDIDALREAIPDLMAIAGEVRVNAPVVASGENWTTDIRGVHQEYLVAGNWDVAEGQGFDGRDMRFRSKVAILGSTVAQELFPGGSPIGMQFRIKNVPFTVIGILASKGQSTFGSDRDDVIFIPITTARTRVSGRGGAISDYVQTIYALVHDDADMEQAIEDIEIILRDRRGVRPGADDNFRVLNITEFIQARTEAQRTLGLLLAATATISLIVGGIGIMNIMLVSVTERTREIGLRMSIGAREQDILIQFLIEAVTLCLIGGIIGLVFGVSAAIAFASMGGWPVLIDYRFVILAVLASGMVGIFFGYYPARRASMLNPIDALRFE